MSESQQIEQFKISCRLPAAMYKDIQHAVIHIGKTTRDISVFFCESIKYLYTLTNYLDVIEEEWMQRGGDKITKVISLDRPSKDIIDKINAEIKENTESVKGENTSKIVRSAVNQYLIHLKLARI